MHKIGKLLFSAVLGVCVVGSFTGCMGGSTTAEKQEEWDGYLWNAEDNRKFYQLSRQEQNEIPKKYLESLNLDPSEYRIGTLSQRMIDNFKAQSAYNCSVCKEIGDVFTIWVDPNSGKVLDDRFLADLQDEIQSYVAEKIHTAYPDGVVYAEAGFYNMPSQIWGQADGVEALMKSEKDELHTYVKVVFPADQVVSEADMDVIEELLELDSGSEIMLFCMEPQDGYTFDEISYTEAVCQRYVKEKES